jgi:hypothetical protein
MLRRPAEPPDTRPLGSFQNRDLTDDASNSPAALRRLLPRDPPQRFVGDAFHEPRSEQRRSDEPVANILTVWQRFSLSRSLPYRLRRYQCAAGRGNEFVVAAEMSCSQFRYRTASSRQTPITWRRVAAEAGAFVEMDTKPAFGRLNFLERFLSRIELFLGEKTILQYETLWRFLWTSICAESHESDRENRNQFEKFTDHFFLQLNPAGL